MSTKTHPPDYVTQAAELLRRIYEDRNPPTTFRERVKLTHWLHKLAERDAKIKWPHHHGKAELLLMVAEAGVYVLPFTEAVAELYEKAKDRPPEEKAPDAGKPAPKFEPTEAQKETAATLRRMYKAPRTPENVVDRSILSRTTRRLKDLHRYVLEHVPGRAFPAHTDGAGLYLEACRARFEGVKTPNLRGRLEEVEAMTYEARQYWERTGKGAKGQKAEEPKQEGPKQEAGYDPDTYEVYISYTIGCCGFTPGDEVLAERADDLKVWEIATAWHGGDDATTGRVVAASSESVILRDDEEEHTFYYSNIRSTGGFIGRVNPVPVRHDDGLTDRQREELKRLRKKLQEAEDDTDWENVLSSTRYKIEKQIFDILHPAGGDPDDWSAWEEGGEG